MSDSKNNKTDTRPRMPAWFEKADSNFFKKHITESVWREILNTHNHEVLRQECEENGIPVEDVQFYWHKSKKISLFAKLKQDGLKTQEIFEAIAAKLDNYKSPEIIAPEITSSGKCAIINLYDAHLDKLSLKAETGKDVTLEDNVKSYELAFDKLLTKVMTHSPDTIIFPIGNDFFHANDFTGSTKKGTKIQYLCSPEEAYPVVCDVAINCMTKLIQTGAKVVIPFVKGNHDEDNVTILGFWLKRLFAKHSNVEFMEGRKQRNYYRYGKNLFGFAHGDKEKGKVSDLPLLMADEAPNDWAKSKFRKFFCGDLHHEFEYKFLSTKDRPGVTVSFLRSVGGSDKWHMDNGWTGVPKTAYADIWDEKIGEIGGFRVNL